MYDSQTNILLLGQQGDVLVKIEKLAYFIWQGDTMSWLRYMTLRSFIYHNPDWKVRLYKIKDPITTKRNWSGLERQEDYQEHDYKNYIHRIKDMNIEVIDISLDYSFHPVQNSDLLRWELLSKLNGIYFDMDILFVKSINSFREWLEDSSVGIDLHVTPDTFGNKRVKHPLIRIGVMTSGGKSKFWQDVSEQARYLASENVQIEYETFGRKVIERVMGEHWNSIRRSRNYSKTPAIAQKSIEAMEDKYGCRFINLDYYRTIYPWDWQFDAQRFYDENIVGDEFGIHFYGGAPATNKFNQLLTEENFRDHKNTICKYAEITYNGSFFSE